MTNKYKSISIFFPTYNEEANIQKSVLQIKTIIEKIFKDYEIIIVNDGSGDKTGEISDKLSQKYPRVKVVHHNSNKGYGGALISGFNKSIKDLIFFTDADLQFDLKEITKLLKFIDRYDVVIGYRNPRRDPFMRLVNAWGWKWLNQILFGLKVRDIDCAFKLFTKQAIKSINIKSSGAMISVEFLIKLENKGYRFKEVPVKHSPRKAGSPTGAKPKVIFKAFKELWLFYKRTKGKKI
ncbi:glycosyltransferase family 2 protein [Patescibacteria group bacterium]